MVEQVHRRSTGRTWDRPGASVIDCATVTDWAAAVTACVGGSDQARLQNTLMAMSDKVCAVALSALREEQRDAVYALIAPAKAKRIREEIRLESRRRTPLAVRDRIIRDFLKSFEGGPKPRPKIYIRPKGAKHAR